MGRVPSRDRRLRLTLALRGRSEFGQITQFALMRLHSGDFYVII